MGIVDLKAILGRGREVPAAEIDLSSLCQHRREKAMGRAGDKARVSALAERYGYKGPKTPRASRKPRRPLSAHFRLAEAVCQR